MVGDYPKNRTWAEIDLDALANNARYIVSRVRPGTELMGVVKGDAYGHGAYETAVTLLENGYTRLAVSLVDEGIYLRRRGITAPILILTYTDPVRAVDVVKYRLTQTLFSHDLTEALDRAAAEQKTTASVHVKVDTGMGRIGLFSGFGSVEDVQQMFGRSHLAVEGIFTHFATADEPDFSFMALQFERFVSVCRELESSGLYLPLKHCCNSAALLRHPEMHMDMVRPGLINYGLLPMPDPAAAAHLQPVMSLHSRVMLTKTLHSGDSVGYNRAFVAPGNRRVATVPVGYADGYSRTMTGRAEALVHGLRVPVIGKICMDACMLDVTEVPEPVVAGDEVVLLGRQTYQDRVGEITAYELGDWRQSICYEATSVVGKRVPRFFIKGGATVSVGADLLAL